jgi:hypothetical protein
MEGDYSTGVGGVMIPVLILSAPLFFLLEAKYFITVSICTGAGV